MADKRHNGRLKRQWLTRDRMANKRQNGKQETEWQTKGKVKTKYTGANKGLNGKQKTKWQAKERSVSQEKERRAKDTELHIIL